MYHPRSLTVRPFSKRLLFDPKGGAFFLLFLHHFSGVKLLLKLPRFRNRRLKWVDIRPKKSSLTHYKSWAKVVVSKIFDFHPYLGKIPSLTNIFQRGWNHQPEIMGCVYPTFKLAKKKSPRNGVFLNGPSWDQTLFWDKKIASLVGTTTRWAHGIVTNGVIPPKN